MYETLLDNNKQLYELYNIIIVKCSMYNANSTLGEYIRGFMYKYILRFDD